MNQNLSHQGTSIFGLLNNRNTDTMLKLSVVVPCFNCENFIEECLESLFNNIPDGVEIVFVNDGSTDKSLEIVTNKFGKEISLGYLRIISQRNQGLSAARNIGVLHAKGEYIAFVDSDDSVAELFYSEILAALDHNPDLIEFNMTRYNGCGSGERDIPVFVHSYDGLLSSADSRYSVFLSGNWFACARVYKKDIISKYRFPIGKVFEDIMTIPFIYLEDLTIYYLNSNIYRYRINPSGISSKIKEKHFEDIISFYKEIRDDSRFPLDILRIQTLKISMDFAAALNLSASNIAKIKFELRKIRIPLTLLFGSMRWPLFYIAPKAYFIRKKMLNALRLILTQRLRRSN